MNKYLLCPQCKKNIRELSWITNDGMRVRKALCKKCQME